MATKVIAAQDGPRLRANCLNFWEVWAQAIALISPTMTAALIVPAMFGAAGTGSWLAYLFGTVMLLFVALNLNQFARRSTSAGSMYAYTSRGLGPTAGGIAGWCLIWAYLFIGIAGLTGFTNFADILLNMKPASTSLQADGPVRHLRPDGLVHLVQGHPGFHDPDADPGRHLGRVHPDADVRWSCSSTASRWTTRSSPCKG